MVDLAEVTLKANSFSAWRETYPETWDWKPLVTRHEHLQAKVEQAGAMPPSIKPVIREEFRSGSKSEDEAFAELSTLQDICQVLATIQDSMVPRERSPDIQFRCVLTQLRGALDPPASITCTVITTFFLFFRRVGDIVHHEGYGWQGVILGWDSQCRMSLEWVAANAKDKEQQWIDRLHGSPWYDILCNDGMLRYGSQMTHRIETKAFEFQPQIKRAPEIGQVFLDLHFDDFDVEENRYLPTQALARRFPDPSPGEEEGS